MTADARDARNAVKDPRTNQPLIEPEPGRQRLRADARVRRRADYQRTQSSRRRASTPHFVVLALATEEAQRIGITVTKRVAGAVGRNRIKRLIREVFRRNRGDFPQRTDVVVIARDGADKLTYQSAKTELLDALRRLGKTATR